MNTIWTILRHLRQPRLINLAVAALCAFGVAACGGASSGAGGGGREPTTVNIELGVRDVTGAPIGGAEVSLTIGGVLYQASTGANGIVEFLNLPKGNKELAVSANGFEPTNFYWASVFGGREFWNVTLDAIGAWAIGRPIVLGTSMVDRASDGSAMTFSLDIAVVGENSEALQTLTSADFTVVRIECGWGGPRDCATDAMGNRTASGGDFSPDGGARAFGLESASARHPYLVGVLAERSTSVTDWEERAPALKSFFSALGGVDAASLASVQMENGATTLSVLGPFTSDGQSYLDAIDQLAAPAEDQPIVLESLNEMIRRAAEAGAGAMPGTQASVLVLATAYEISLTEINSATALARQLGVRINTVPTLYTAGLQEMAVRTGGFVAEFRDSRQLAMILGASDQLLAGATPFYRMQFRVVGPAHTFVAGGNARVNLRVNVPTSLPSRGIDASFDVAIP